MRARSRVRRLRAFDLAHPRREGRDGAAVNSAFYVDYFARTMTIREAALAGHLRPVQTAALAPTVPEARNQTLDVLRGLAMFGVLWSNLNNWYGTTAPATYFDKALSWTQAWLIEARFYTLLGFLFGLGFAMQLVRAESGGQRPTAPYVRRLVALLVIGVVHGAFIWSHDILAVYATLGFALLLYRGLSQRGLLIAAAATFLLLPLVRDAILIHFQLVQVAPAVTASAADVVYAHGTASQVFALRASEFFDQYSRFLPNLRFGFLTLFVLGMWVGRTEIVQELPERLSTIRKVLGIAIVCYIASLVLQPAFNSFWPRPPGRPESLAQLLPRVPRGEISLIVNHLTLWSMAAIYACSLTLLVHRTGWSRRLAPLAAAGRMPLTTYLTQSLVCTLLFYSYGLGWYGRVGFTGMFGIALALFSLQMMASVWWLGRYRFGPMEWLWRSLAYGEKQPMRSVTSPCITPRR